MLIISDIKGDGHKVERQEDRAQPEENTKCLWSFFSYLMHCLPTTKKQASRFSVRQLKNL